VFHHQERAEQIAVEHIPRVVVGHFGERTAGLQAVVEYDHVDGTEGVGGVPGQACDERLIVEVPRDVQVVWLRGVYPIPTTGQQQPCALAAEVGAHRLADSAVGARH
jgi:hypothetical protein